MSSNPQFVDLDLQSSVKVINSPDPSAAQDVATKAYVDNYIQGLSWKDEVQLATTGNITLSGEQTIDGILTSASRVLIKSQILAIDNGIYNTAAGAWTRALDANASAELNNATVFVTLGTVNAGRTYTQTTANPTLGVSNIVWVQYATGATYTAGDGLTESPAFTLNVNPDTVTLAITADVLHIATGAAGNGLIGGGSSTPLAVGAGTGITVNANDVAVDTSLVARWKSQVTHSSGATVSFTHSLGKANLDYMVQVFYTGTGATPGLNITSGVNIVKTSNGVTVTFNTSQSANTIGIVVVG